MIKIISTILIAILLLLISPLTGMGEQMLNYPTTKTTQSVLPEDDNDWVSIVNIGDNDGVYTSITAATYDANDISYQAKAQGFGFAIPAGTTIDGIIVQIERRTAAGAAVDYRVQLLDEAGTLVGDNKADTVNAWPAADTMKTYGDTTDLWGWTTTTVDKLNDADFGVVLSVKATAANTDIYVDYIRITIVTGAIEDFTTYTEVDTAGYLASTTSRITATNLGATTAYFYKDFGANYFNALDTDFELYSANTSVAYHYWGVGFSNAIGEVAGWATTDPWGAIDWRSDNVTWIWLERGPQTAYDYWATGTANTVYYNTMTRAAGSDTVTMTIYSDAARTTLLDTLSVAGYGTAKWQYSYGFANWLNYTATSSGYTQNMDLNEAAATALPAEMEAIIE